MVVNEKGSEQNRQGWQSRTARERLDLSVSVEETLVEPFEEDGAWSGVLSKRTGSVHMAQGPSLIPPRLSLQSRVMPTVSSDNYATSILQEHFSGLGLDEADRSTTATHDVTVLMRLAQRLAASSGELEDMDKALFPALLPEDLLVLARQCAAATALSKMQGEQQKRSVNKELTCPVPVPSSGRLSPTRQSNKHRLAGRMTKIRLETASGSATSRRVDMHTHASVVEKLSTADAGTMSRVAEKEEGAVTSAHMSIVNDFICGDTSIESMLLPAIMVPATPAADIQEAHVGSGIFECGQCDVTVVNGAVTAASIVLLMLTTNPGPVVVQYVSLQPQRGFTAHLTAPTIRETAFNYILF